MEAMNWNWIRPLRSGNRAGKKGCDVSITVTKGDVLNITFYRGVVGKICHKEKFMSFAFVERNTRCYFHEEDNAHDGYGLTATNGRNNTPENRRITVGKAGRIADNIAEFIGDYTLLWDKDRRMWYIDLTKKVK